MKRLLPLRIFLVQLLFTLGAGGAAVFLVRQAFESYGNEWRQQVVDLPPQIALQPLVNQVAAAYLRRLQDPVEEQRELTRERISEGISSLVKAMPAIESLIVVDSNLTIQYASDRDLVDLTYTNPEYRAFLSSEVETRRPVTTRLGKDVWEVVWPIRKESADGAPAGQSDRLGAVLVRYRKDESTLESFKQIIHVKPVSWDAIVRPLLPFLLAGVMASVLVAAWTAFPVRRLVRALDEYRDRGYRGGLDTKGLDLPGELAAAVRAINEMGGRLESLDARGREREALLGTLAQSLEEGMIALDSSGSPVAWNAAAMRLLAPAAAESGRAGSDESEALRFGLARYSTELRAAARSGSTEILIERDGEETVLAEVTRVPIETRPGVEGVLLLMRDLSMLRKVEGHLLEAGRFATLAHLAGALAHEIRNPLNSIGLNAAALKENLVSSARVSRIESMRDSVETIEGETRRLTDLLNNYLGLLRSTPVPGAVDVRDLCRRVIQLLRYSALKSRVEIGLEGADDVPPIHGVPDRIQQAILNLTLNAIQATPRGGRVTLRITVSEGAVKLTVSDTGPGLPPEIAEHVFEAKVSTKSGGTGLGLPLVRMIAEAHGGTVRYAPGPDRGASFTLTLPAG